MNKKILIFVFIGVLITLIIPLTIFLGKNQQERRSRASASTTLSFNPTSTTSNPIQKKIGDTISFDIIVDPGSNLVTFVRLQLNFDPAKLALSDTNAFVPNISAFPITIEGPVTSPNTIAASVSIGSDPTKAIQKITKLGTINFKAIGGTQNTPTEIKYTSLTQVLSAGSDDQASENILSTTAPAYVAIDDTSPTSIPTTTPYPTQISTILKFDLLLHGIGSSGDNPNPNASSLSNKNPLHPQRDINVVLIDSNNQQLSNAVGSISYDADQGNFIGTLDLGPNFKSGDYNIKVKSERYLRKLVQGIVNIQSEKENMIPQTALVAGDVKTDNLLNVLDYNILLDCGYGAIDPLPLDDPNALYSTKHCQAHEIFKTNSDIDDNGIINSADYNLFLRELSVQNGD